MRIRALFLVATILLPGRAWAQQPAVAFNFDGDREGQLPQGWIVGQTRSTVEPASWQVVAETAAPSPPSVLSLVRSENYNGTLNLALAQRTAFRDLDLSVKVMAVRGQEDQGGGPVWRCRDENNYYTCRFNPLEGNFRLYRVADGVQRRIDSVDIETRADAWHTVRVEMMGSRITCSLDGTRLLAAEDDTLKDAGMVGLCTKADAVTSFDDLVVREPLAKNGLPENASEGSPCEARALIQGAFPARRQDHSAVRGCPSSMPSSRAWRRLSRRS